MLELRRRRSRQRLYRWLLRRSGQSVLRILFEALRCLQRETESGEDGMTQNPGPKELQRRQMREDRHAKKAGKKPSVDDLRGKIAIVNPPKHVGKRRR
jgi:hypothetical protein